MNYEKIMSELKTVREFKKSKGVKEEEILELIRDAKNTKAIFNQDISFVYYENGENFFSKYDGQIGYGGKLIQAPSYVAIIGPNTKEARIDSGYKAEIFRFFLEEKGLSSCWISTVEDVDYNKTMELNEGSQLLGVIGIGTEYSGIFKKNTDKISSRKGIADLVSKNNWDTEMSWEELETLGLSEVFYLAKLAPSWGNIQPWSYLVKGNSIYLAVENDSKYDIEKGIAALYLEKACESKGFSPKIDVEIKEEIGAPENKIVEMIFNF